GSTLVERLPSTPGSLGNTHVATAHWINRAGAGDLTRPVSAIMEACLRSMCVEYFATRASHRFAGRALCSRPNTQQSTRNADSLPRISPGTGADCTFGSNSQPPALLIVSAANARTTADTTFRYVMPLLLSYPALWRGTPP